MDWTYFGELGLSLLIFAPGVVLLALYLIIGPLTWKRSRAKEDLGVKPGELARDRPRPARSTAGDA